MISPYFLSVLKTGVLLLALISDYAQSLNSYAQKKCQDLQRQYPVSEHNVQDKVNSCLPRMQHEFYDFVAIQKYGISTLTKAESANLGKEPPTQPKIRNGYFATGNKSSQHKIHASEFYNIRRKLAKEWSLLEDIRKTGQISSDDRTDRTDLKCNSCKYLLIFAACLTGVVMIMAAYVFYFIKFYHNEKNETV